MGDKMWDVFMCVYVCVCIYVCMCVCVYQKRTEGRGHQRAFREVIKELAGRQIQTHTDTLRHTQTHTTNKPKPLENPVRAKCFWKPRQQDGCYLPRAPMDRLVGRRNPLGFYTFNVACCAHVHKLLRAPARAGNTHAL